MVVKNILIISALLMLVWLFSSFSTHWRLLSSLRQCRSYVNYETSQFFSENAKIDSVIFCYKQFISEYRRESVAAFTDLNTMNFGKLDTLIQPFIDTSFLGLYVDNEDYYRWLRAHPCTGQSYLKSLRELRLREMYYDIIEATVRSQGCVMYLNMPTFARSVGTDSIYFGFYDISHDHVKYEVSVNEKQFVPISYSGIPIRSTDTLDIGVYCIRLTGSTTLDTIRDELTLVWEGNRWKRE